MLHTCVTCILAPLGWMRFNHPCLAALQKSLNRSQCRLGCGLWWAQGTMCYLGVQIAPCQGAFFRWKDMCVHARWHSAMSCAKMAEWIEMPFGLLTEVGPRKYILGGMHTGTTWRILVNRPCATAMWPFCQITLATCYSLWFVFLIHYNCTVNAYSFIRSYVHPSWQSVMYVM